MIIVSVLRQTGVFEYAAIWSAKRALARISTQLVRGNGSAEFVVEGAVAPPGHLGVGGEVGLAEHG
jgi:hypothetical protein